MKLLKASLLPLALFSTVHASLTINSWVDDILSGISRTIYDSPKLDGTVEALSKFLAVTTDLLIKLKLSGPRIENRAQGQCAPIIIIYVRGTSEAPNVGTIVGPPAFLTLRNALKDPKKVIVEGVEWAGLLSTYSLGGDPKGIADMVAKTTAAVNECPSSKVVMAGFSQGALMTRAAIAKLPVAIMKKVSAIVLWGDPAKRANVNVEAPVVLNDSTTLAAVGGKVKIVCHPLDAFCHNSDVTTPFHYVYFEYGRQDAVDFILKTTGVASAKRTVTRPRGFRA